MARLQDRPNGEMPDIDEVVKGLECCKKIDGSECKICPYKHRDGDGCGEALAEDALELLKKQKAMNVAETPKDRIGAPDKSCPKCNIPIYSYVYGMGYLGEIKYCPWCGQAVKWDD